MVAANKKIKDYLRKGVRKLKHRKGFGVHSPFAYAIITEVIEEKLPYYAYRRMLRTFDKQAPFPHKVACLLLRLANRFKCRRVLEIGNDGGYTLLPLILTDSRLHITSLATPDAQQQSLDRLSWLSKRLADQVKFLSVDPCLAAPEGEMAEPYDMIVLNGNPFLPERPTPQQEEAAARLLLEWLRPLVKDDSVIFARGIQPHHRMEQFWDQLCDLDQVSITMDLFDYGLAILKPRFFKQHYIVSF